MVWNKRNNDDIEEKMIFYYLGGMSSREVAKMFGFKTHKTVLDVLKKHNIKARVGAKATYYNTTFFKKINSHDIAYISGLICADGYIIKDYKGFSIQLQKRDGYILRRIKKRLGKSCSVTKINCQKRRDKGINAQDMLRLNVHNREIAMDLKKMGIVKNKTHILKLNKKIPNKYISSFFRGVIDGDGTVGVAKNGNIWCQIVTASEDFAKDLYNMKTPVPLTIQEPSKNRKTYTVRVAGGNCNTIKFLKWIYNNRSDLFLRRKYEKVQSYIC